MSTMLQHLIDLRDALSHLLSALGFEAMSRDVLAETDWARLSMYARVILKNSPGDFTAKSRLKANFIRLGLL